MKSKHSASALSVGLLLLSATACGSAPPATTTTPAPTESEEEETPTLVLRVESIPTSIERHAITTVVIHPGGRRQEDEVGIETGICYPAAPRPPELAAVDCFSHSEGGTIQYEVRRVGDALITYRTAMGERNIVSQLPFDRTERLRTLGDHPSMPVH